jgi:hypothetical protein
MAYFIEKQHTCVGCGCVFRYRVDPESLAGGLMRKDKNMVATHPCPGCGLIQPEMVMWTKVMHVWMLLVTLVAGLVLAGMASAHSGVSANTIAHVGIGAFTLIALIQIGTALANPNSDRQANLALAEKEIAAHRLELVSPPTREQDAAVPKAFTIWGVPGLLLLLPAPLAFAYPLCFPPEDIDLPMNPDLSPSVVAPGDRVSFTFRDVKVKGVTGTIWRGQPTVRVLNAREFGLKDTLVAEGRSDDWGKSFRAPRGSGNAPLKATIHFTIPKDDKLEGKTLRLAIHMPVTYPADNGTDWSGSRYFKDAHATLTDTLVVKLVPEKAVTASRSVFLPGLAGAGLSLLGAFWLMGMAWRLKWHASASEVVSAPPAPQAWQSPCAPPPGAYDLDRIDQSKWGNRPMRR